MQARGQARILWVGLLVALPSGAAVAVSILSGNQASLVGVAISASLLRKFSQQDCMQFLT